MNLVKHLPNGITCLNLFSGCAGVWLGFQGNYVGAAVAVLLSALFDFLDGLVARALNAYSEMGKELDSLADVVSFGLVPGSVVFAMLSANGVQAYSFIGFLIPIFSALRLAKFNIDDRQMTSFIGLPTPANALFWAGLTVSASAWFVERPIILAVITIVFALLLVAELPMFSLKFKNLKWRNNKLQFIFLFVSLLLIIFLQSDSIAAIILWYIILSVVSFSLQKKEEK